MYGPAEYLQSVHFADSEQCDMHTRNVRHSRIHESYECLGKVTDIGSGISKIMNFCNNEISIIFERFFQI